MSREPSRKGYYNRGDRDPRERREWNHNTPSFDKHRPLRRSSSRHRSSRSPRRDKELIDDNILSELSKLPEPSELWDNQFQDNSNFSVPTQTFAETMSNQNYQSNYQQPSYSGMYDDFPPMAPPPPALQSGPEWNTLSLPAPTAPAAPFISNMEDQIKKEAAIESEMRQQKAALCKQREDYIKKVTILKKELDTLKDQRNELRGDPKRSPSPDTRRFLKENTKLQLEIQNKLKTISNVVDMLNGIIGEEAGEIPPSNSDDETTTRSSKRRSRSPPSNSKKFNYVYYDPEMHWCRVCNEFPATAKDYLNHLHSPAHHKLAAAHMEAPWHTVTGMNEGFPSYPSAPTKRTPIKGLQFFVPSTAWYCKLCDQFIGDLHCASAHLKSVVHSKNYGNFVDQNPHWETDWMSDRQKAVEKSRSTVKTKPQPPTPTEDKKEYTAHTITFSKDGFHTKKKNNEDHAPEEKKKKDKKKSKKRRKRDTSSSSDSSPSSDSEPSKKKKHKKRNKNEDDDRILSEWMSSINSDRLSESDRKLLDSLKHRMKAQDKQSQDRSGRERERSILEITKGNRDSERREGRRERDDSGRRSAERRRDDRTREPQDKSEREEPKKPEKKMPFIGKMPVFKSLSKTKVEEQKKEELKKKEEDDEAAKKRREEMDAEIQKKVAEFKEKIAKAQLERGQTGALLGPPPLALPTELGAALPPAFIAQPHPHPHPHPPPAAPPQPMPSLPKDFQDALDIIFPNAEMKNPDMSQDLFGPGLTGMPGFPMGMPNPYGIPGMMPPQNPFAASPGQMMMGFEFNGPSLFQKAGAQLYDTHVPMTTNHKNRPNQQIKGKKNFNPNFKNQNTKSMNKKQNQGKVNIKQEKTNAHALNAGIPIKAEQVQNKADLDDLAMLGIDASDVGAGL